MQLLLFIFWGSFISSVDAPSGISTETCYDTFGYSWGCSVYYTFVGTFY